MCMDKLFRINITISHPKICFFKPLWKNYKRCQIDFSLTHLREYLITLFDLVSQGSMEEEDDFLHGETPHGDSVVGMTPGSYDSHLHSPRSVGSPPISFLQRPFWSTIVVISWSQMGCSARVHTMRGRSRTACVSADHTGALDTPALLTPVFVSSFTKPSITL